MQHSPDITNPGPGPLLHEYVVAELGIAIACLGRRGSHVHKGCHLARKSIRRTRAALLLAGLELGPGSRLIDRELRRLNRRLSPLRDAQALVEAIERLRAQAPAEFLALLGQARRIAAQRRAILAKSPAFAFELQEARMALLVLQAALTGLPWRLVDPASVDAAFASGVEQRDEAREVAFVSDDARDWHRWRRRARRVSQMHRAAEAAGFEVFMAVRDKHVAEELGLMQDTSLVLDHCGKDSCFPKPIRRTLRDYGRWALAQQRDQLLQ